MCKRFSATLFLFFLLFSSIGQPIPHATKQRKWTTYYAGCATTIDSLSQLPSVINFNLIGFLHKTFGNFFPNLSFSDGQAVDLHAYFAKVTQTYSYEWIVPKYELIFILNEPTLAITDYEVHLGIDEYGQFLSVNWPRADYDDKAGFLPLSEMNEFAIRKAKQMGYDTSEYNVVFAFNDRVGKQCRVYSFARTKNTRVENAPIQRTRGEWDCLEIDCKEKVVLEVYSKKRI